MFHFLIISSSNTCQIYAMLQTCLVHIHNNPWTINRNDQFVFFWTQPFAWTCISGGQIVVRDVTYRHPPFCAVLSFVPFELFLLQFKRIVHLLHAHHRISWFVHPLVHDLFKRGISVFRAISKLSKENVRVGSV